MNNIEKQASSEIAVPVRIGRRIAAPTVETDNYQLFHGNCFDVLSTFGVKAAAIITDMPYGNINAFWDQKPPLTRLWKAIDRLTIPTANFIFFSCGRFTHELYNSNPDWYRYDLVWCKSKSVGFPNSNLMQLRDHESLSVFGRPGHKKQATYNAVKVFNKRNVGKRFGGGIGSSGDGSSVYGKIKPVVETISDGWMHPGSVICCAGDAHGNNQFHSTQKPIALMQWLIESYTNPGDLIIDPFMGSGSTGVAAIRCGRRFIGIELNRKFFEASVNRIRREVERLQ
jgi:site-specific DNA-methyltransferase (adenine-specific)